MITWRKTLNLTINFIYNKDFVSKKSKLKNLNLEYIPTGRFNHTLLIKLDDQDDIQIDAEYMIKACQKIINISKI